MAKRIRTYSNDAELVAERRRQIVAAASKLFLRRGYESSNTRELSKALGMSKGTLYHYVGSKSDVLYLVFSYGAEDQQRLIERMQEQTKELTPLEAFKKSIGAYFRHVDEVQDMFNFNNHAIVDIAAKDRHILFDSEENMVRYFDSIFRKGIEAGVFRKCETELLAHNVVIMASAWAHRRWFLRKRYALDEYVRQQTDQIVKILTA